MSQQSFEADRPYLEQAGVHLYGVSEYLNPVVRKNALAMDAQPTLFTTANSGIPSMFTTAIDPETVRILFAPTMAAQIMPEKQKGNWVDQTILFPVVEGAGEVSSYGDFNTNGKATVNADWPQRQNMLYQIFIEYGDLEMDRAAAAKLNWKTELENSAVMLLNRYQNLLYFFGYSGLQNYGILNDPALPAAIQPGPKAYNAQPHGPWITGTLVSATPNEIFLDIQAMMLQAVNQSSGVIQMDTPAVLVVSPQEEIALTSANSFGVTAKKLIDESGFKITVKSAVQYGAQSALNFQGSALGNIAQLIFQNMEGQETGYVSYSEKLKTFPVIRSDSSYRQKWAQGCWGAIIRMPFAIVTMVGI